MNTNTLIKPEPLSIYELHSPAEKRKHAAEVQAYYDALRAIERAKEVSAQAAITHSQRYLTDDEFFEEAVKRKAEQDARDAEAAASRHAAELEKIAYKMSSPAVAEIMENTEFNFLTAVVTWANRGYTLEPGGILFWGMGLYHAQMTAPAVAKKAGK